MQPLEPRYLKKRLESLQFPGPIVELGVGWDLEFHRQPFREAGYTDFYAHDFHEYDGAPLDFIGDICDHTTIPDGFAGTALLFNVLEHVKAPWLAVDEAYRVLKPGGMLAGSVPLRLAIHRHPRDYWRVCPDGLGFLLRRFKIVHFAIDGDVGLPANLLWTAEKDVSRDEWEEHNQVAVVQPEVILDNDYLTNNPWKRAVVRMLRRSLGMSLEIWDGPWNEQRMRDLGYANYTVARY
jgi:SAM-dependent methyltransferase